MNELALFAGAGGGVLGGILLGWRTVLAVELDPYCRKILARRQDEGFLEPFPIWDDAKTFRRDNPKTAAVVEALAGMDRLVVTAGFLCQPYSSAGKREGSGDERNLWPDTVRIVREVGPEVAMLENVPGLLCFDYFGEILGDLAEAGYDAEWDVVSAGELGAPHRRDRLWVLVYRPELADAACSGRTDGAGNGQDRGRHDSEEKRAQEGVFSGGQSENMAHADEPRGPGEAAEKVDRRGGHERGKAAEILPDPQGGRRQESVEGQGGHGEIRARSDAGVDRGAGAGWWSADPADADRVAGGRGREGGAEDDARHVSGAEGGALVDVRWGVEPGLGRVADGVAHRLDRLRAVGNGQVAVVAAVAFLRLARRAGLDLVRFAPAVTDGKTLCG